MPPCNFIQSSNSRPCSVSVHEGHCVRHQRVAERLPPRRPDQCEHYTPTRWCSHTIQNGKRFCPHHYTQALRFSVNLVDLLEIVPHGEAFIFQYARQWRERYNQGTMTYIDLVRLFLALVSREHPEMDNPTRIDAGLKRLWADEIRPQGIEPEWWEVIVPPPPVPRPRRRAFEEIIAAQEQLREQRRRVRVRAVVGDLDRLARDSQNVHTAEVVRQTREGEERLLSMPTNGKDSRIQIVHAFSARFKGDFDHFTSIIADISLWYNRSEVRVRGDKLYARLLDGLWTLIQQQSKDIRTELVTRLWQEVSESHGMCAEGHISRLMNVMVGFDDNFKPPVTQGQLLQDRLAAISLADYSLEKKLKEAEAVLEELHVPHAERAVWLDAF